MGKQIDEASAKASLSCAHCGEYCPDDQLKLEDHFFCCAGCQTVYQILKDNNLADFYQLDENAGRSQRKTGQADFTWLQVSKLANRFVRYRDEERWQVDVELPAIHCASCIWLLERFPQLLPGVRTCIVDITRKQANIDFDPNITNLQEVAETLARIGYPPHFHQRDQEEAKTKDRGLIFRLGVAGFGFGNIMLLSFPEYFGLGADAGAKMVGGAMGFLLLGLSLPVLFYAGSGFFKAAWYGLKARRATIDLPIAIGMVALFSRSVYEIVSGTGPGYLDSLAGLIFFLLIGRWFQTYTFARLNFERDYRDYFPVAAHRLLPNGTTEPVASEDLAPGDNILVKPGQLIPADGVLANAPEGGIDYSFVTGEAEPRIINEGQEVFAGGRATTSPLSICISKATSHSYLLQLWQRGETTGKSYDVQPPEALVKYFTAFVILLAFSTFIWWYPTDIHLAFRAATAVLIIACPCALALAAPFSYGTLQRLFGKAGYYLRGPGVIKAMGKVDAFVFDKTGTLIDNDADDELIAISDDHSTTGFAPVFLAMAERSDHPRSRSLAKALRMRGAQAIHLHNQTEIVGEGLEAFHHGQQFKIGKATFCGLSPDAPGTFACVDGTPIFALEQARTRLRRGGKALLSDLDHRGPVCLISGDQAPATTFWSTILRPDRTHFEMSPFAKQEYVADLKEHGRQVLMVGDGLNDAGALTTADVGLAVSDDEARFSPACDGILTGDELRLLPQILLASSRLRWVLWTTFGLAFCYNLIGLSYAVSGTLSPIIAAILMPVSSITIVVVASLGAYWVYQTTVKDQGLG